MLLISFNFLLLISQSLGAYEPDKITNLPGIPSGAPPFDQYSGYLNATGDKQLHYWFVESQNDPVNDPLVLWLNGGPGCSSLDGYLSENGPFHVNNDGATLYLNEYSWNRNASVIYLESPVGVGFSYSSSKDVSTNDKEVAEENFVALTGFFDKFPEYVNNSFFLTGESYAGIYIPTLAEKIKNRNSSINLQGFAIGNGLLNFTLNMNSMMYYAYYHNFIGQDLWNDLQTHCCNNGECHFYNSTDQQCQVAHDIAMSLVKGNGLNMYSVYSDCAGGIPVAVDRYRFDLKTALGLTYKPPGMQKPRSNHHFASTHYSSHGYLKEDNIDCVDATAETTYLNRPDVRLALHIPASVQAWHICSDDVLNNYTIVYYTVRPLIESLLREYRGFIYNGDADIVCNFLGDQWFVKDLQKMEINPRRVWRVADQVAGFVQEFENVTFVTVKGAGHMVPQWRPEQAFYMISQFLVDDQL